ncbi:RDD family protein [Ruania alkalisoli]|uniref:RDD family protein n=1 Tax=Ruania alkalisoli TaxID=2779775 RepID=A0A7M1SUQ2_9MICO|nr:RDD family protein [Ruania alkalisoli]QOR71288.1 RDD family protein [Ruania alkalisoli]
MTIWEVGEDDRQVEGVDETGRPDPHYAAALGLVPAPLPRRAVAAAVDAAIYLLLQVPYWVFTLPLLLKFLDARISWYGFTNHPQFILAVVMLAVSFALSLAYCIVQLVFHGRKGITIGKGIMGLRSINVATLERPGVFRVLLRVLVVWASGVVLVGPLLFLLSPLFDPEKRGRGWHDRVGRLWLVDVREGLQPYDAKRMRIARKTVTAEPVAQPKPLPSLATPVDPDAAQAYRPGARVSAGVLGVARPHGEGPRPVVGLSGMETPQPVGEQGQPVPGHPVLGAYRRPSEPEESDDGAPTELSASPSPHGRPEQGTPGPDFPASPSTTPDVPAPPVAGPVVTGSPWGAASPVAGGSEVPPAPPSQAPPAPVGAAQHSHAPVPPKPAANPAPAPPSGPVPAHPQAATSLALQLDSGEVVPVSGPVVIGRNPVAPHTALDAHRHPMSDDTRSVSKTHLLVRPGQGGIEVLDQNSTNGTGIVHQGIERELAPGTPALAVAGDTLRIGERTATVVPA